MSSANCTPCRPLSARATWATFPTSVWMSTYALNTGADLLGVRPRHPGPTGGFRWVAGRMLPNAGQPASITPELARAEKGWLASASSGRSALPVAAPRRGRPLAYSDGQRSCWASRFQPSLRGKRGAMAEWRELTWDEAMRRGYEALRSGEAIYEEIDAQQGRSNIDIEKHLRRAELKLAQANAWLAMARELHWQRDDYGSPAP